ncbi:MAG TPA: hypothetical protein VKO84_04245 [Gaiellaceae bacterium]|nr:hypothetical protein [Gaiellaceae bacterium]
MALLREQLEPVAPWVGRVETADARERVVPLDALARSFEPARELVELLARCPECRVRFARRLERILDADVELAASGQREPDAAARAQRLRLLELLEAEQVAEEAARRRFAAGRRRELDVV